MAGVSIPLRDHKQIANSGDVRRALKELAAKLAKDANSAAGIVDGYVSISEVPPEPDLTRGSDASRAHVWAKTGEAIRAERKEAILMGMVGDEGL